MKKKSNRSMILIHKLEGMHKKIFERHKKIIIQHIGNKPGVYALYDGKELYYVGRASDLAKRVNYHLKDRHSALWTHFSVYLTKKAQYANDIEAVIISIADPRGNKAKPNLGKGKKLKDILRKAIKKNHQEELRELGLGRKRANHLTKGRRNKNIPKLKNYFKRNKPLMKTYKGKTHKAILLKSGKIKYRNKLYDTPSSAAQAIVHNYSSRLTTVNGWRFWFIKNDENNWVELGTLD